ncbi:cyanobacterial porin [Micractinium conductrix]|uniref:Cyanobacterial porin n=1 Tax=Micractinium conductrix TaxID=554055 RepID=A0A2P6V9A7_9CHLO|nr:cyanobacterial porin [Micractinium conductrix]|eukprot:PSC70668.1 cyanobacterial porin [Micractinium conductrix]
MWILVCVSAAALALFKVGSRQLQQRKALRKAELERRLAGGGSDEFAFGGPAAVAAAASSEPLSDQVAALTRLTQESFAELVKLRVRLEELEGDGSAGGAPADASLVGGRGPRAAGVAPAGQQGAGHGRHARLSGVLRMGGGLMWAQDGAADAAEVTLLDQAALKLGSDVLLHLGAMVRGGQDSVHAECRLESAAESLTLRKVLYNCRLGRRLRLVLAPFGARGSDAAYTLNPLAGQGLSGMVRDGSPLHRPVLGSLAGVALEARRAWFNAGYFARASPGGRTAHSLLAQLVAAPTDTLSAGLTLAEHRDAPFLMLPTKGRQQQGQPAAVGALAASDAATAAADAAGVGTAGAASGRQLGAMLAWRLGDDAVVHGWAAADGAEVEREVRAGRYAEAARPRQWGLSLGSYPDGSGNGWALGVGRTAPATGGSGGGGGGGGSGSGSSDLLPDTYELSLQYSLGDGLLVTPGMVLLAPPGGKAPTAFIGMRTAWAF